MSQEKTQQSAQKQEYEELDINSFLLPAVKQVYNAGANKKGIQQPVNQTKKKQQKFQPGIKYQNQGLSEKKGEEHKTFYHFTKIYKVDDYKFLGDHPQQQQSQQQNNSNLEISQHNNIVETNTNFQQEQVQLLRQNVENYLVMKKYHKKEALKKFKESLKNKKNNESMIYQFKEEKQDPIIKEHFEQQEHQQELQKDEQVNIKTENKIQTDQTKEQQKEKDKQLSPPLVNLNVIFSDGEGSHTQVTKSIGTNKIQKQFLQKYYHFLNTSKYGANFIVQKMATDYETLLDKLKAKDLKVKIRVPKNVQAQMSDYNDYYVRIQGVKDEFDQSDIKNEEKELLQDQNVSKILNQVIDEQLEVPQGTDGSQESQNEQTDEDKQSEQISEKQIESSNTMKIQLNEPEEDKLQKAVEKQEQIDKEKALELKLQEQEHKNQENSKEENKLEETKPQQNAMSIIDQLLEAKDVFDVDLSSLKPKPEKYPQIPTDIIFRSKEEKQIFEKLYNWLFEIEMDLNRERKEIQEQKRIRNQVLYDSEQIKQDIEGDSSADDGDDDEDEEDDERPEKQAKN